ncbi:hypothetical protein [Arthrobacter bambusae]|uniref:Uncharacterized protein n=1 Tax=Arthrobacter bambusae TaxID=1338426 RepID=A0AAW8DDE2_9MICC|nr:hypothetical protein [Arthrobacter bambusae]MDP9903189.1 hypothetical protein [Arthrobacter bambusae]MDQ0128817.1 hypothetical protein [Arthrobacter bambusae]MDQ0180158.1 hypothetical protein [Arthrobacter bambusae]
MELAEGEKSPFRTRAGQKQSERAQKRAAYQASPAGKRELREKERKAADDALRANAMAGDPAAKLRLRTQLAARDLSSALRRSGITRDGTSKETQRRKLTDWQKAYVMTMVSNCVAPLRQGMTAEALLETVGMGVTMWLVSPNYRQQVKDKLGEVHGAIMNRIARRGEGSLRAREQRILDRGGSRSDMDAKSIRRLEKIERLDRHGLESLTPHLAALMEIGIAENAYQEMRAPGADPAAVARSHAQALSELYAMAQRDGIEAVEVSAAMRKILAHRMMSEPELGQVFQGLAHGKFERVPDKLEVVDITNGKQVDRGSFLVRPPMTILEHESAMQEVFTADLLRTLEEKPELLDARMYELAMGVHLGFPDVRKAVGERANSQDPTTRQRLMRSGGMFVAMANDDIPVDLAAKSYSQTLVKSISELADRLPAFGAMWDGPEGERWRQGLNRVMDDFSTATERVRAKTESCRENAATNEGVRFEEAASPGGRTFHVGESGETVGAHDVDVEIIEDDPNPIKPARYRHEVIEDAELVGDASVKVFVAGGPEGVSEHAVAVSMPAPEIFAAPSNLEGLDVTTRTNALLEAMSRYMGNDIARTAHLDGNDSDLAANSHLARSVYGHQMAPAFSRSDDAATARQKVMDSMRLEMVRLGLPPAEQDLMFAASYIRGLEKAVLADPAFESVLRSTRASEGGPAWQEIEFARTAAQLHTGTGGLSYRAYVTKRGMDPDLLHQVAETEPVNFGQIHQAQALFADATPGIPLVAGPKKTPAEESTKRRRRSFIRGWINREYNAEGENVSILDPETDAQFNLTD